MRQRFPLALLQSLSHRMSQRFFVVQLFAYDDCATRMLSTLSSWYCTVRQRWARSRLHMSGLCPPHAHSSALRREDSQLAHAWNATYVGYGLLRWVGVLVVQVRHRALHCMYMHCTAVQCIVCMYMTLYWIMDKPRPSRRVESYIPKRPCNFVLR